VRPLITIAFLSLASMPLWAEVAKPCTELKAEIAKRLDANNVQAYSLEIVPAEKVKDAGKVVGSCDGGKKKIVYSRTPNSPQPPATASSRP
jgi:Protein of unknown function (DUF1161)